MNSSKPEPLYYLRENNLTEVTAVGEENAEFELPVGRTTTAAFAFAAGACAFACVFALLVVTGILSSRKTRSQGYNIYVVFLLIPDAMFNASLVVTSSFFAEYMSVERVEEFNPFFFRTYFWFNEFYYFCNTLINAAVTREMFKLLKKSKKRMRYSPPSARNVCIQCIIIYIFVAMNAFLKYLDVPWALKPEIGDGNLPFNISKPAETTHTLIISLYYLLFFFIPIVYVFYVNIYVWAKKLLPKSGKTRVLSLYFTRIVILYVTFYLPYFLLTTIRKKKKTNITFWLEFCCGDLFYPLQTFVTTFLILTKPDVYEAFKSLFKNHLDAFKLEGATKETTKETAEESTTTRSFKTPISVWQQEDVYDVDADEIDIVDLENINPALCENNEEMASENNKEMTTITR